MLKITMLLLILQEKEEEKIKKKIQSIEYARFHYGKNLQRRSYILILYKNSTRNPKKIFLASSQLSRKLSSLYKLFLPLLYLFWLSTPLFIATVLKSTLIRIQMFKPYWKMISKLYRRSILLHGDLLAIGSSSNVQESCWIKPNQSRYHPMAIGSSLGLHRAIQLYNTSHRPRLSTVGC